MIYPLRSTTPNKISLMLGNNPSEAKASLCSKVLLHKIRPPNAERTIPPELNHKKRKKIKGCISISLISMIYKSYTYE